MLNFKVSVFADKLKGWIKEIQESPVEIQKKTHVNVQDDGSAEPVELVFPAGWVQYWWLTSVEFDNKGKGKMSATFCFNPQLYPYLINIDRYTKINMETVLSFKSFYTIRLYEHFSQLLFKANPVWIQTMSVETVRHVFKLEGSYKNSSNMRTKVFDVAIEEINAIDCGFKLEIVGQEGGQKKGTRAWHVKLTKAKKGQGADAKEVDAPNDDGAEEKPKLENLSLSHVPATVDDWRDVFKAIGFNEINLETPNSLKTLGGWVLDKIKIEDLLKALMLIEARGHDEKPIAYYDPVIRDAAKLEKITLAFDKETDALIAELSEKRNDQLGIIIQFKRVLENLGEGHAATLLPTIEAAQNRFNALSQQIADRQKELLGAACSAAESPAQKLLALLKK
jgi:hypothetical protein